MWVVQRRTKTTVLLVFSRTGKNIARQDELATGQVVNDRVLFVLDVDKAAQISLVDVGALVDVHIVRINGTVGALNFVAVGLVSVVPLFQIREAIPRLELAKTSVVVDPGAALEQPVVRIVTLFNESHYQAVSSVCIMENIGLHL